MQSSAVSPWFSRLPPAVQKLPWYSLGLLAIWGLALGLRFWGLSRFNTLVFDEVYFAKFADHYLTQTFFIDGHPPLGKYLIAIGIWIGERLPWLAEVPRNNLTGSWLAPWSYRWVNALTGSLVPLVVAGIARQVSDRRSYGLMAGLLMALDGLLLVESRYALINVYLLIFGLLGHWCLLRSLGLRGGQRYGWLAIAGLCFGASVGVKWNGLGFLLGVYGVWLIAWGRKAWENWRSRRAAANSAAPAAPFRWSSPVLERFASLSPIAIVVFLGLAPLLTYSLIWIPHLQSFGGTFWSAQAELLSYHRRVGDNATHPYCSPWYTWPGMVRHVLYFYQTGQTPQEIVPIYGPPLPSGAGRYIFDVHAMGNPFLWWLSSSAIALCCALVIQQVGLWGWQRWQKQPVSVEAAQAAIAPGLALYLVINWAANWLPWMLVQRCTFLYHYMGSSVFSLLAIAWMGDRWLHSPSLFRQRCAIALVALIVLSFLFWLPVYLGLPLTPSALQMRRWLPTW